MVVQLQAPPKEKTVSLPARQKWTLTVDKYHQMLEAEILTEDDRLELLGGEIFAMSPINPRHAGVVIRLVQLLSSQLAGQAFISPQNPVHLDKYSEPQPDVALLAPRDDFYAKAHPIPKDVLLLIEVSDTSLEFDRDVKGDLYAKAGIGEYWIVDLENDKIDIYREPSQAGYRVSRKVLPGEELSTITFPEIVIEVDDILG